MKDLTQNSLKYKFLEGLNLILEELSPSKIPLMNYVN